MHISTWQVNGGKNTNRKKEASKRKERRFTVKGKKKIEKKNMVQMYA